MSAQAAGDRPRRASMSPGRGARAYSRFGRLTQDWQRRIRQTPKRRSSAAEREQLPVRRQAAPGLQMAVDAETLTAAIDLAARTIALEAGAALAASSQDGRDAVEAEDKALIRDLQRQLAATKTVLGFQEERRKAAAEDRAAEQDHRIAMLEREVRALRQDTTSAGDINAGTSTTVVGRGAGGKTTTTTTKTREADEDEDEIRRKEREEADALEHGLVVDGGFERETVGGQTYEFVRDLNAADPGAAGRERRRQLRQNREEAARSHRKVKPGSQIAAGAATPAGRALLLGDGDGEDAQ